MDLPRYEGNIHPDEWICNIQKFDYYWRAKYGLGYLDIAISLVDATIKLPDDIFTGEELCNALKEDISFTIFKNTNKRKLQSLKYNLERNGGDTSKFISTFRKLCYNAEINDIEEQKKYLYKTLPNNHFDYISNEFYKKMKDVDSINELVKRFEDIVFEESNLIRNESIVALKHVATGKYLSSIKNLSYITGSKSQMVFVGSTEPVPNSLWKIKFDKEFATYSDTSINLQHIKSEMFIGLSFNRNTHYPHNYYYLRSPCTKYTEVSCNGNDKDWIFRHSKFENYDGSLKSNDTINLSIKKTKVINDKEEFLSSHDIHCSIGNYTFQEVVCLSDRLGRNEEWCIELIHEGS
ncbi:hypothetical protein C1646_819618 [Rhizophagus diaphanus]|nr:hypothetical protein C1646_819618 [Rhizophagus diaphanus] [Rhizophagus sp. MUCL 43196]